MDSMAIEARLFKLQYERIIQTYKSDSISYERTIKNDSIALKIKSEQLATANKKLKRAKIKASAFGIGGGFIGWLISRLFT